MRNLIIGVVGIVLIIYGHVWADTVEVNLFDLGCPTGFNKNAPYWMSDFDLGVTFTEITNVYIDWSGTITAGIAIKDYNPDEPYPLDVSIKAYLDMPIDIGVSVWGGEESYPSPELFYGQSVFQLRVPRTWNDLLDGRATIWMYYGELIIIEGRYIESGYITLDKANFVVEGVVPEPATLLLISLGVFGIRANRINRHDKMNGSNSIL
jgi:hypothetical protein